MFIGTSWRKAIRKGRNISGHLQPIDMDPGSSPGVTGTEGSRIRPVPIPSFRTRSGIHVYRNEAAEAYPEITKAAITSSINPDTALAGGNADNEGAAVDRSGGPGYIESAEIESWKCFDF